LASGALAAQPVEIKIGYLRHAEVERIEAEQSQMVRVARAARELQRLQPDEVRSWTSAPPFPARTTYIPMIGEDLARIRGLGNREWMALQDRVQLVVHPDRAVVAVAGDGDFLMTGQELATAVQHRLDVVVLVVNNGMYGTIRMHQERAYPGRVTATELENPDFAALARAYGAAGEAVTDTEAFPEAFERALAAGRPALLDLHVDPEAIAPGLSLAALRRG
jgi:hypothetical protein